MKAHTSDFKNKVKLFGRELDSIITYENNGETIELGVEELNSISPHYEGAILKSVMRQLDIDSNVDIPLGTIINYQFGVKIADEEVEDYRENYEYLDFGNYVVYSSEKQEDTKSYKIICYDKMLFSMIPYNNTGITYPITINNYINAICTKLGLTFKNNGGSYANASRQIQSELYMQYDDETHEYIDMGYTFRDVLDELAQATGSTICINEDGDELEIRYIQNTDDGINEEYLKDINVNFGEKYGPVNSIVLSRSAGSDNVYIQDQQSIAQNGLCEIKISDNQIMNWNDREDYLADLLTKLGGLEYYINDYSSTGIAYYNLCDRYTINIDNGSYSCIMFNDELNVTQGLEENIHTDMPEESETDYTKADKTDRRINQTYLIVDKQNGTIESVVSEVQGQNTKIAKISQDVAEIKSEISNISGMTMSQEGITGSVQFTDDTNASQPITIKIHPNAVNLCNLYPSNHIYPTTQDYPAKVGLVPSGTLTPSGSLVPATGYPAQTIKYPKKLRLIFYNRTANDNAGQTIPYELPYDLLYYDAEHYDEFYYSLSENTCYVMKRCKFNADGTTSLLAEEERHDIDPFPIINLTEGKYNVYLENYSSGYLYIELMASNIYTDQFYTKVETNSIIDQTATNITLGVNQTLSNYSTTNQMNSAISLSAQDITSTVSQTYATKNDTTSTTNPNSLSSRIKQTAKDIVLEVVNGATTSGIKITTTKEDGTTTEVTQGTIEMTGLVKFTDLSSPNNYTTISGGNIKTGTIDASQVNVTNLNASNITSGTISGTKIEGGTINGNKVSITNLDASNIKTGTMSADKIKGGTINATNINVTNLTASNITRGTIEGIPYTYSTSSNGNVKLGDNTGGPIMGYRGTSPRWSIASFTAGGRFQTFDSSGNTAAYFNHTGAHTSSDKRLKNNINNIDEETSLNIINNLQPIEYTYKADEKTYHRGLIAQEVKKVLNNNGIKNEVYEKNKEGYYSLNYIELIPDLINCVKYLSKKVEMLEKKGDDK